MLVGRIKQHGKMIIVYLSKVNNNNKWYLNIYVCIYKVYILILMDR